MKKLHLLGMAAVALFFASCGSEKQMTDNQPQQQTYQQPAQQKSEEDPELAAMDKEIKMLEKQAELERRKQELARVQANLHIDPCGDYYDDENFMRDYGIAAHLNQGSAQTASIDAAKANLRKHMAEFVQGLTSSYINLRSGSKPADDIERKIEGKMDAAVQGMLDRARKICQQNEKNAKGEYVYYAAFEISVKDLKSAMTNTMNSLSEEEKTRIDYDEYRFSKKMDEDYQKMLEAKKNAGY